MTRFKETAAAVAAIAGSALSSLFGGWDSAVATLLIFMGLDYLTGLAAAGIFHASPKSETGALNSRAGWKGLCRKGMSLLIVLVGARLDLMLGTAFVRDGIVTAFIVNEVISLMENAALMGVPYPQALKNALDILTRKEEEQHGENQ